MTAAAEPLDQGAELVAAPRRGEPVARHLRSVVRQRSAIIGLTLLGFFAFVAIFAAQLAPYDPIQQFDDEGFSQRAGPCIHVLGCPPEHTEHFFGTRWQMSATCSRRVIYGARDLARRRLLTVGFAIIVGVAAGRHRRLRRRRLDT